MSFFAVHSSTIRFRKSRIDESETIAGRNKAIHRHGTHNENETMLHILVLCDTQRLPSGMERESCAQVGVVCSYLLNITWRAYPTWRCRGNAANGMCIGIPPPVGVMWPRVFAGGCPWETGYGHQPMSVGLYVHDLHALLCTGIPSI